LSAHLLINGGFAVLLIAAIGFASGKMLRSLLAYIKDVQRQRRRRDRQ
jgi:hypothetical protein